MNIYQHLLFIIPIVSLFYYGCIRFFTKTQKYSEFTTGVAVVATMVSALLFVIYVILSSASIISFYNWLGTL